nr:MAG TPA: hypothetical protein [Caudoviricetes sp.]
MQSDTYYSLHLPNEIPAGFPTSRNNFILFLLIK